jgi:GTPase SAR1 family protein
MMANQQYDEIVKYILVGDSNVGKTSIMKRFCEGKYSPKEKTTVGL